MILTTESITLYPAGRATRSPFGEDSKGAASEIRILAQRKYLSGSEGAAEGVELGRARLYYTFTRSPATAAVQRNWRLRDRALPGEPVFRVIDVEFPMMDANRWIRVLVQREEIRQ